MKTIIFPGTSWVGIDTHQLPGPLHLHLAPDEHGRWRPRSLVLEGQSDFLVPADLRQLPLAAIEEWLQADADLFGEPDQGPHLSTFTEAFGAPAAQDRKRKKEARAPRLQRPTKGLTDEFLTSVWDAYRQAVADGKRPAPELARQLGDGASPRTIHKWVSIARQRKIMPPAPQRENRNA